MQSHFVIDKVLTTITKSYENKVFFEYHVTPLTLIVVKIVTGQSRPRPNVNLSRLFTPAI